MAKLVAVEGIGQKYAGKLQNIGIRSTQSLLERGASARGRKEIAEKAGISAALVLEWVNHVDLFRIRGVGEEYADLLEEAGVDTVPELAQRNPANLHEKMAAVNRVKKLVRRLPVQSQVDDWVKQAKKLPRKISY